MKELLFFILLFVMPFASAQDIENSKLKYDENFNPYIETTIKNTQSKAITTIEFIITHKREYSDFFDFTALEYKEEMVKVYIPAYSNKFISFYISEVKYCRPCNIRFSKVRFDDEDVKYY